MFSQLFLWSSSAHEVKDVRSSLTSDAFNPLAEGGQPLFPVPDVIQTLRTVEWFVWPPGRTEEVPNGAREVINCLSMWQFMPYPLCQLPEDLVHILADALSTPPGSMRYQAAHSSQAAGKVETAIATRLDH